LSECVCPDLEERLKKLSECPHLHPSAVQKPLAQLEVRKEQERNRPNTKPSEN
jgi:hypothetical protein